ncbi:MAG: hypothetical protein IPM24_12890 [Bryobacterales bacterium]|nr:hypothetical protein [Bryobacterales bacterium]
MKLKMAIAVLMTGIGLGASAMAQGPGTDVGRTQERTLLLVLTGNGFAQKEFTIAAGVTRILVRHRLPVDLTLRLNREAGPVLREAAVKVANRRWNEAVLFSPGRYRVEVAEAPEWHCVLTVVARTGQPEAGEEERRR